MTPRIPRTIATFVALLLLCATSANAQTKHLEVRDGWSQTPVTNGVLDARLRDAASQYRQYAPVPRIALYDLTFPKDSLEAAQLNGFGVIVITAMSQDSAELPLARVYLRYNGREVELRSLARLRSTIDSTQTAVRATFGTERFDGLYLVPLGPLQSSDADIVIDFAIRRNGFRIGVVEADGLPTNVRSFRVPMDAIVPPLAVIQSLVMREFPGLPEALITLMEAPQR